MSDFFVGFNAAVALFSVFVPIGFAIDKSQLLREGPRKRVAKRIEDTIKQGNGFIKLFLYFFDSFLKPSRTGRPHVVRSLLASCITLIILSTIWMLFYPERVMALLNLVPDLADPPWLFVPTMLIISISVNFVGDFFSLWESRFVMGYMTKVRWRFQVILLLLDIASTILIFYGGMVLALNITLLISDSTLLEIYPNRLSAIAEFLYQMHIKLFVDGAIFFCGQNEHLDIINIIFYTTLFSSVWLWIFLIGVKTWPLIRCVGKVIDICRYPLTSIMLFGSTFLGLLIIIGSYIMESSQLIACGVSP